MSKKFSSALDVTDGDEIRPLLHLCRLSCAYLGTHNGVCCVDGLLTKSEKANAKTTRERVRDTRSAPLRAVIDTNEKPERNSMKILTALCCVLLFGLTACALNSAAPRGGVAVTIAYPASPGAHFDWDYYVNKHIPMVSKLLGPAVREVSIDKGLAGAGKNAPAPFVAIATMRFDSVDAFEAAASPHTAEIMADIAKFTDIKPVIQVSSVEVDR